MEEVREVVETPSSGLKRDSLKMALHGYPWHNAEGLGTSGMTQECWVPVL